MDSINSVARYMDNIVRDLHTDEISNLFTSIESPDFMVWTTTSSDKLFIKQVLSHPDVARLVKFMDTQDRRSFVANHVLKLARVPHDVNYQHPHDTAIAAYLVAIGKVSIPLARELAGLLVSQYKNWNYVAVMSFPDIGTSDVTTRSMESSMDMKLDDVATVYDKVNDVPATVYVIEKLIYGPNGGMLGIFSSLTLAQSALPGDWEEEDGIYYLAGDGFDYAITPTRLNEPVTL